MTEKALNKTLEYSYFKLRILLANEEREGASWPWSVGGALEAVPLK